MRVNLRHGAAVATALGMTALLTDELGVCQYPVVNLRLLFGLVLVAAIAIAFTSRRRLPGQTDEEYYRYTRRVSQWVYILVFGLALFKIGLQWLRASGLLGAGLLGTIAPQQAVMRSMEDFQIYVAYSILPLFSLKALALSIPLTPAKRRFARARK